jgi:hypothetical protein
MRETECFLHLACRGFLSFIKALDKDTVIGVSKAFLFLVLLNTTDQFLS